LPATDLNEVLRRTHLVCSEITGPQAAEVDRDARWPVESLRALQKAGIGGLTVPEASGGLGHGLLALVQVCEELGRECVSTALCLGMHCVAAAVIATKATPDQRERHLEPIARGDHLTTLALSEPGTGIHFYVPQAKLVPETGGDVRVTGTKAFVTNGSHADSYVVSAGTAEPGAAPHQFSCVVVSNDAEGVTWGSPWSGMGVRGNSSREMKLEGVRLAPTDLLGKQGDQLWYVFRVITPYFLAAMTGSYLGAANAALDQARSHLTERGYSHNGSSPAESPVIQHRLGTLWGNVERTRRLAYHAARSGDAGSDEALALLLSAKAEVAECAVTVVNEALTLCGGKGYRAGGTLERCLRDVRAAHVMSPTTDLLRTWTGRALLGLPILGH
jgi:alkylation response protein AidB-like acyl-CoA dehydrogenase